MREEKLAQLKEYIDSLKTIKLVKTNEEPKFIRSIVYESYLNNGEVIKREKILKGKNNGSAAVILPVTKENNVLLTVEPRVFSKRTVGVGIPAGYIEHNENGYDAALRELAEETGYVADEIISLGGFYQDMGISSAYNELFLGLNSQKIKEQSLDEGEYIKYFECKYDEAIELIDMGYIEECNAIITLTRAKKYMEGRR